MKHHKDVGLHCHVGDVASDIKLVYYADADFAGDLRSSRSTSGGYLCLVGPNTYVPVTWLCKRQGAVSHSSTEAETISLDTGLRLECLSALTLWDEVYRFSVRITSL